jgi:hypothetical protein
MPRKSKSSKKYTTIAKIKKLRSKSSKRSVKRSNKRSTKKSKSKKSKGKMTWFGAVAKARKELGLKGFVAINKGPEGKKLYNKAKEIYGK